MLIRAQGMTYILGELLGWRGTVARWLVRVAVRLARSVGRPVQVPQPRVLEQFNFGDRVSPAPVKLDRYEQPADPAPIPLTAFTDPRAHRYAYGSRRRFASPDGDFERADDATSDPVATKSTRIRRRP